MEIEFILGRWLVVVASGGSQQSLFYCKIYDPQTWRYSDLTLTLSVISSPPVVAVATLVPFTLHYAFSNISYNKNSQHQNDYQHQQGNKDAR